MIISIIQKTISSNYFQFLLVNVNIKSLFIYFCSDRQPHNEDKSTWTSNHFETRTTESEFEHEQSFYPQPPPTPYQHGRRKVNRTGVSSEKEERTAMIIGIVAGALIAVVLVILLLLWLKSNGDRNYKADPDKRVSYGHGANAALLGSNSCTNGLRHPLKGSNVPLNGSLCLNGNDKAQVPGLVPQKPKKRDSKDIKEWYV